MSDFKQLTNKATQKRIDSPMAKYSSSGQLSCVVCNQAIKSELMWTGHLNSKTHTENKKRLKMELIGGMAKPLSADPKKANETNQNLIVNKSSESSKRSISEETGNDNKKQKIEKLVKNTNSIDLNAINAKFNAEYSQKFTESVVKIPQKEVKTEQEKKNAEVVLAMTGTSLPEGFFDDPDLDAKVRGQSRSENLEAEFEEFKKIIQSEEVKSEVLIEKDDLISNVNRDIEEVDELIDRWTKIENLHVRRENLIKIRKEADKEKIEVDSSDDEEVDLDNVLNFNLRSKNRF